jgi:hypothetical protein
MGFNSDNRETLRDALAALLTTALVGTGLPAQHVYGYPIGDFGGDSPVVVVESAGSERVREQVSTKWRDWFHFNVFSFVLCVDPVTTTTWDEDDAEDALDLIEKKMADALIDNTDAGSLNFFEPVGRSTVDHIVIGGADYRRELVPVRGRRLIG